MSTAEIWRRRVLFLLLIVCAAVPPFFHYRLVDTPLYNHRFVGGLHPTEILMLRQFGQATVYLPLLFIGALLASVFRPHSTSTLLVICTSIFILSLLFHLLLAFVVITLHV